MESIYGLPPQIMAALNAAEGCRQQASWLAELVQRELASEAAEQRNILAASLTKFQKIFLPHEANYTRAMHSPMFPGNWQVTSYHRAVLDVAERLHREARPTATLLNMARVCGSADVGEMLREEAEVVTERMTAGSSDPLPSVAAPAKPAVSRPKLAQAAVIAYFLSHPDSQPTAQEIGKSVGLDAATIRNTPAWKLHTQGQKRAAEDVGDSAHLGDVDPELEQVIGRQERGRDRRNLRRRT